VGNELESRLHWFKINEEYWVHVAELKQCDTVTFTPSTFDFEFLDTTARRFEVSYDDKGHRRGKEKRQRPYLLEELDDIEKAWEAVRGLMHSQIKICEFLIESKRMEWDEPRGAGSSKTFQQFVHDVLKNVVVHADDLHDLEHAAVSGMLADALELHLTIAKEKVK
jgi:hypothetical protein